MTRTEIYKKIVVIQVLDASGNSMLAAELERDLLVQFLRDAQFNNYDDEQAAQMILSAVSDAPDRFSGPPTAE